VKLNSGGYRCQPNKRSIEERASHYPYPNLSSGHEPAPRNVASETDTAAQLAATHAPEQKSAAPRLIEDEYRSARRFVTWLTSLSARSRCSALNVGLIRLRAFRRRRRSVAHGLAPGRLE